MELGLPDEAATLALGSALSRSLEPGTLMLLHGELGAGKTTLARGLLRGLGFEGRVRSPTYTLVEAYEFSRLSLYHFDFYRFDRPEEFKDSGLSEVFDTEAVCIVEWAEKAGDHLPPADLEVFLCPGPDGSRRARLQALSPRGQRCLTAGALQVSSGTD